MPIRADARKQQQQQEEESGNTAVSTTLRSATPLADQEQRKALKFGFSSKGGMSKVYIQVASRVHNKLFTINL